MLKRRYFACVVVVFAAAMTCWAEFQVNTSIDGDQRYPAIAMNPNGNFVVVWRCDLAGVPDAIYGQRFYPDGTPVGSEFQISTSPPVVSGAGGPFVAMDSSGNFVVTWVGGDGSDEGIFARRYNAQGAPITGEFLVNTITVSRQLHPKAAGNDSGDFVIVWECAEPLPDHRVKWHIRGQLYDASGTRVGSEFDIEPTPHGHLPDVAMHSSGDFVVAWMRRGDSHNPPSEDSIRFRRYNADGTPKEDAVQITGDLSLYWCGPSIAIDGAGNFVIAYKDGDLSAGYSDVYVQGRIAVSMQLSGRVMARMAVTMACTDSSMIVTERQ
jgi:hypothetical protein